MTTHCQTISIDEKKEVLFTYSYTSPNNVLDLEFTKSTEIELQLNNLNEPVSGYNSRPAGYLEWSGFYNRYLVHKTEVECTFVNTSNDPVYVGIALTTSNDLLQQTTWANWRNVNANTWPNKQVLLGGTGSKKDTINLKVSADLGKLLGNSNNFISGIDYGSIFNTNPQKQLKGYVYALTNNGLDGTQNDKITCFLTIYLHTTLYQQKLLLDTTNLPPNSYINEDNCTEKIIENTDSTMANC